MLLSTILISCILSSYAFSALTKNFHDSCVTGAKVAFKRTPSSNEALTEIAKEKATFYEQKANLLEKEFKSYYLSKELREADATGAIPKTEIFQFFDSRPNSIWSSTEKPAHRYMVPTIPDNDTDFFKHCE